MNWRQSASSSRLGARPATPVDRGALAALMADTWRRHGLLAVEEQIALLSSDLSAIAYIGEDAVGFLGLSPRAPAAGITRPLKGAAQNHFPYRADRIAEPRGGGKIGLAAGSLESWVDVSLTAVALDQSAPVLLRRLLKAALPRLRERRYTGLICVTGQSWLAAALRGAGFEEEDRVMSYVRPGRALLPVVSHRSELRPVAPTETDALLDLNAAAFGPFWRYDARTVLGWLLTADRAMFALRQGRPAGFALTTLHTTDGYAQLIRVAIQPMHQGQGLGHQLVADAIQCAAEHAAAGVALNTQVSNRVSRHLYEALGFRSTGGTLSVLVYRL